MFTSKLILHLRKTNLINLCKRNASSALYITGDKAHETFSVLTPYVDFEEQLKDKNKIEENLKLRQINTNLDELISVWLFYKKFQSKKNDLEKAKTNIGKKIQSLNAEKDKKEIEKLMTHGKMIKDDLKAIRESFYDVEENAMTKILSLPNKIHEKTPHQNLEVIYTKEHPLKKSEHHLKIAEKLHLVEFKDNSCYYLKNDAALFELSSTFFLADKLLDKQFTQISNSDFCRSVIVEGCGIDYTDSNQIFTINETDIETKHENSRLHLTGGANITSFMAYYTKHIVYPTHLPLKLFTIGRKYVPNNSKELSLFNTTQETCVNFFVATKDCDIEMNIELDNLIKCVIEFYEILGYNFRLTYLPVKKLKNYESLRVSIELFSPFLQNYCEVGYISVLDNYVSKRLLLNYGTGYNMNFPKVLSGTIFSVPKVLACLLESEDTLLHEEFKKYFS